MPEGITHSGACPSYRLLSGRVAEGQPSWAFLSGTLLGCPLTEAVLGRYGAILGCDGAVLGRPLPGLSFPWAVLGHDGAVRGRPLLFLNQVCRGDDKCPGLYNVKKTTYLL